MIKSLKAKISLGLLVIFFLTATLVVYLGSREVGSALTQAEENSVYNLFQLVKLNVTEAYSRLLHEKVFAIEQRKQLLLNNSVLTTTTLESLNESDLSQIKAQQLALDWILRVGASQGEDWRVINQQGHYISHPDAQFINSFAFNLKNLFGRAVVESVSSARSGRDHEFAVFIDPQYSQNKKIGYFYRFPAWGWTLVQAIDLSGIESDIDNKQQQLWENLQHSFSQIQLPGNGSAFIFNRRQQNLVSPQKSFLAIYQHDLKKLQQQIIERLNLSRVAKEMSPFVLIEDNKSGLPALQIYASYFEAFDCYTVVAIPKAALAKPVNQLLMRQSILVGIVFLIGLAITLTFARKISKPLLLLIATMREVTQTGNYALRNSKASNDEIGQLVDGFNVMLAQIETKDRQLENHQKDLELIVVERTTELHQSILSLELARKQADLSNQAKSTFLANMTHELRTPLVGLLGMNELLIESTLNEQQRSFANVVEKSGLELLALINQILDFSRIDAVQMTLNPEPVDLMTLVEDVVLLLADHAYQKDLAVVLKIAPDAAWQVEVDPQRLRQILLNLLGNAIKFTKQGCVAIELTRPEKDLFCFRVSDTGIGMSSEEQNSIFEAFSQVDDSISRNFDGTGLGLSIVRELVELMDGQLSVKSQPNEGSTFEVRLPLPPLQTTFIRLPNSPSRRAALLCDPCPVTRDASQYLLNTLGFTVVLAADDAENVLGKLQSAAQHNRPFALMVFASESTVSQIDGMVSQAADYCHTLIRLLKKIPEEFTKGSILYIYEPVLRRELLQYILPDSSTANFVLKDVMGSVSTKLESIKEPNQERILIVDDKETTRELVTLSLNKYGLANDQAANAEEAFEAIDSRTYSLILMDVNLPGINGLQITKTLRAQGVTTPIYAMTAHGEEEVFELCIQSGMQGILRKPFRQSELLAVLEIYHQKNSSKEGLNSTLPQSNHR